MQTLGSYGLGTEDINTDTNYSVTTTPVEISTKVAQIDRLDVCLVMTLM